MPPKVRTIRTTEKQRRWTMAGPWTPLKVPSATTDFVVEHGIESLYVSEGNPWWKLGKTAGDVGGPFWAAKRSAEYHSSYGSDGLFDWYSDSAAGPLDPFSVYHYWYPQYFRDSVVSRRGYPPIVFSTDAELKAWGTEGVNRTLPTESEFDFSTMVGEILGEGIPSAVGFAGRGDSISKKLASENLNYQFGIAPIVRDVQDFANVVRNSEKLLDRYLANAGKRLKRSTTLVNENDTQLVQTWTGSAALPIPAMTSAAYNGGSPKTTLERDFKRKIWFEACYTYFIPRDPFLRKAHLADQLLGTTPDLATLWNLTPWSWAADWASNLGSVIENMSAFLEDGLVMHYGYVMEHTTVSHRYTTSDMRYKSYPGSQSLTSIYTTESKKRIAASPFGFAVDWDGFTPRQLGILASLGITRGRR